MAWSAKLKGAYAIGSDEWCGNVDQINAIFTNAVYGATAIAGMLGNMQAESGMNPWRWQGDKVNYNLGYGLYQFTPARTYTTGAAGYTGYAPSLSVTQTTPGASPTDGICQCECMLYDRFRKWTTSCWRSYWDKDQYPFLWSESQFIREQWGSEGRLTMAQFASITDLYAATFAFLACYEGPSVPNMDTRYDLAVQCYEYLEGHPPPDPDPPGPGPGPGPGGRKSGLPIWAMIRRF